MITKDAVSALREFDLEASLRRVSLPFAGGITRSSKTAAWGNPSDERNAAGRSVVGRDQEILIPVVS